MKGATSLDDLAAILGYKPSALAYIIYKLPTAKKYKKFSIPKSGGGEREICAPNEPLKTLQRRLANVLNVCRDKIRLGKRVAADIAWIPPKALNHYERASPQEATLRLEPRPQGFLPDVQFWAG